MNKLRKDDSYEYMYIYKICIHNSKNINKLKGNNLKVQQLGLIKYSIV